MRKLLAGPINYSLDASDYACNHLEITTVIDNMISEAESEVMKILWSEPGLSAEQIKDRLNNDWQLTTVKTLLNRLLSKDILRAEKEGRRFCYFPLVSKDSYLANETQGFLQRVFDGGLAPIFTHFAKYKGLKAQERAALTRLLAELKEQERE